MHTEGSVIFADPETDDPRLSPDGRWRCKLIEDLLDPANAERFGRWVRSNPDGVLLSQGAQYGIKTVINLRMTDDILPEEEAAVIAHGMTYKNVPLSGWRRPTDQQVKAVLALIESATPPVLIHCERGADRTGTIAACYRIRHEGWTADQGLAEAEQLGMAWIEFGMKAFVRDFARDEGTPAKN